MKKIGRPGIYDSSKYEKLTNEYLEKCEEVYRSFQQCTSKSEMKRHRMFAHSIPSGIPTVQDFSSYCGINRSTTYDWMKKYPDFSDMVERVKMTQNIQLINGGLMGIYNSKIIILILYSNGYINKNKELI